tara:strand:+ start:1193 stop:1312 length:120 start_codon:yes stop_codon:yes gene_type:complete
LFIPTFVDDIYGKIKKRTKNGKKTKRRRRKKQLVYVGYN